MTRKHEIDFTSGPLLKKIIIYALPIIGVNILQLLFTAADVAVLGIFTNDQAVAAVGATSQIVNLLVGFFVGLSVGANVLVARAVGARDGERAKHLVGTSIVVSVLFGAFLMVVGILLSEQFLIWTNCAESVLPYAKTYLQIYFLGMPIIMLYNFSAAILRAVGDTLRPLIFLAASGVANILLNIFFIVVVGLDVEGVAIATVASQLISAIGALVIMIKNTGYAKIEKKYLRIDKKSFVDIFAIGFPMGLSKCTFAISNLVVVSSINALGDLVMAANSITKEFDAFILETLHGISLASLAVISQNLGAKKIARIKRTAFLSIGLTLAVGVVMGAALLAFGRTLCGIMTDTEVVIDYCMVRIAFIGAPYVLCGLFSLLLEIIRGLGHSNLALGISIFANVILRLFWIWTIYPLIYVEGDVARNYGYICVIYPISWITTIIVSGIVCVYLMRKLQKKFNNELNILNENTKELSNVTG